MKPVCEHKRLREAFKQSSTMNLFSISTYHYLVGKDSFLYSRGMKYLFVLLSLLGISLFGENQSTPAAPTSPATPTAPAVPVAPKVVRELTPPPEVQDYGAAFFKMILMLVALLVLVVLTVWIIKRWGFGKIGRLKDKQSIQILEKRILSPKTALYTVEIEGSRLLIVESQLEVRALHQWQIPSEEV